LTLQFAGTIKEFYGFGITTPSLVPIDVKKLHNSFGIF